MSLFSCHLHLFAACFRIIMIQNDADGVGAWGDPETSCVKA